MEGRGPQAELLLALKRAMKYQSPMLCPHCSKSRAKRGASILRAIAERGISLVHQAARLSASSLSCGARRTSLSL